MFQYPQLAARLRTTPPTGPAAQFKSNVINYLVDVWLDDYANTTPVSEIVEVSPDAFSYLFDITAGRTIAAWGISAGRAAHIRDASRMAGHPLSAGSLYHRGHTISGQDESGEQRQQGGDNGWVSGIGAGWRAQAVAAEIAEDVVGVEVEGQAGLAALSEGETGKVGGLEGGVDGEVGRGQFKLVGKGADGGCGENKGGVVAGAERNG